MVNTFLPYADYKASARVLDRSRLGKQRAENINIIVAVTNMRFDRETRMLERVDNPGWKNHPATTMWADTPLALADYHEAVCAEWSRRGYLQTVDTVQVVRYLATAYAVVTGQDSTSPAWLGDERVHAGYRSNLLRKDPNHYREYFDDVEDDLPYYWPA